LKQYQRIQNERIAEANRTLPAPLTHREVEVLQQLAAGSTNKEIAQELCISEHTVKSHVIHVFNKIGVNDRTQASVWAASQGLL
jgi:DNA-binding NarL/FixJ family response regulator